MVLHRRNATASGYKQPDREKGRIEEKEAARMISSGGEGELGHQPLHDFEIGIEMVSRVWNEICVPETCVNPELLTAHPQAQLRLQCESIAYTRFRVRCEFAIAFGTVDSNLFGFDDLVAYQAISVKDTPTLSVHQAFV